MNGADRESAAPGSSWLRRGRPRVGSLGPGGSDDPLDAFVERHAGGVDRQVVERRSLRIGAVEMLHVRFPRSVVVVQAPGGCSVVDVLFGRDAGQPRRTGPVEANVNGIGMVGQDNGTGAAEDHTSAAVGELVERL